MLNKLMDKRDTHLFHHCYDAFNVKQGRLWSSDPTM